ncbi:hypothetical protein [Halobacterium zhouii]|uniref:hypothetical protein n=1 Tax=Halobacterium zhouii TaxID=2902624 RepID=UPI001E56B767|nr:hypothetical protein [Halobacterium zhouii]
MLTLAGCLKQRSTDSSSQKQSMQVSGGELPPESDLTVSLSVTQDIGTTQPPSLKVTFESERPIQANFGPYPPLSSPIAKQKQGTNELLVIPSELTVDGSKYYLPADDDVESFVPSDRVDGCWTANSDIGMIRQIGWGREITPATPTSRVFHVLNHPENSTCFAQGEYHVTDSFGIGENSYTWGFDIVVQ